MVKCLTLIWAQVTILGWRDGALHQALSSVGSLLEGLSLSPCPLPTLTLSIFLSQINKSFKNLFKKVSNNSSSYDSQILSHIICFSTYPFFVTHHYHHFGTLCKSLLMSKYMFISVLCVFKFLPCVRLVGNCETIANTPVYSL